MSSPVAAPVRVVDIHLFRHQKTASKPLSLTFIPGSRWALVLWSDSGIDAWDINASPPVNHTLVEPPIEKLTTHKWLQLFYCVHSNVPHLTFDIAVLSAGKPHRNALVYIAADVAYPDVSTSSILISLWRISLQPASNKLLVVKSHHFCIAGQLYLCVGALEIDRFSCVTQHQRNDGGAQFPVVTTFDWSSFRDSRCRVSFLVPKAEDWVSLCFLHHPPSHYDNTGCF